MRTIDMQLEDLVQQVCTRKYGDWNNKPDSIKMMLYSDVRATLAAGWEEMSSLANGLILQREAETGLHTTEVGTILHGNADLMSDHQYLQ